MDSFTSKTIIRVHSSDNDYYFEIGEDLDGLGNVEIRYFEKEGDGYTQLKRMSFDPACIDNLIKGLRIVGDDMQDK